MILDDLERDALGEVLNMGVGQAAHALSQLAGHEVLLSVPSVRLLSKSDLARELGERGSERICAVRQEFVGTLSTGALLMFPVQQSLQLVQMMVGGDVPLEQLGEMEQEALAEIGNILLNAVVSSMADSFQLAFEGSLPQVELGPVGEVLCPESQPDEVLLNLQIDFSIEAMAVTGYLAFMLDVASIEMLRTHVRVFLEGAA